MVLHDSTDSAVLEACAAALHRLSDIPKNSRISRADDIDLAEAIHRLGRIVETAGFLVADGELIPDDSQADLCSRGKE